MNNTVTIQTNSTTTEEAFKTAALNAGILQEAIAGLVIMNMTNAKYDVDTRNIVSDFLQKRLVQNPSVLKLFNDFANELAYNCLIDYIFDVASDAANPDVLL